MNWRHTDFQSVALPTELPRRQRYMLTHPFSPSIEPPLQCDMNPLTQAKRMYYILPQAPTLYVGPNQGKGHRSPMSRYSHHRPRRNRAVWDRPAPGTRLLPNPHSLTVSQLNPHYKRCPKAERLRLRSDQSSFRPVPVTGYGRFPDKNWHALSKGPCQVRAPLTRRIILALSGDAHEHGVMLLNRAIEPRDSAVVALGELIPPSDGIESTPPYLRMVGHFWWSRLPHTEIISRLLHVLSEARGCRKAGVDVEHPLWRTTPIGTGVAAFLRNRPGPSIPSPSVPSPVGATGWSPWGGAPSPTTHERNRLLAHTPIISHAHPFPSSGALFPRKAQETLLGTIKQARTFD